MAKKKNDDKKVEIRRLNQCKTLDELRMFLENSDKATSKFDMLLLKGGKLSRLLEQFNKIRGKSNDFKTKSKIRAHVKHRESKGWKFQVKDAESDDPFVKVQKIA